MADRKLLNQVSEQCRAVAHLATCIAEIHSDKATIFKECPEAAADIADLTGASTAQLLETLGDILNGMDAVGKGDEWVNPILLEARRLWQTSTEGIRTDVE